jgi:AcrR family transcriptional regulator
MGRVTTRPPGSSSPRREELLDRAYRYALEHGLADLSLRPLAAAIGSSPRVLLFLFGSKDGLVRELLAKARADELGYLAREGATGQRAGGQGAAGADSAGEDSAGEDSAGEDSAGPDAAGEDGLTALVAATWRWLAAEPVRPLLTLWTEAYGRSLVEPDGPWSGFAGQSVADWLDVLAAAQPADRGGRPEQVTSEPGPAADRTLALAVLRGCLLDLLATGDTERVGAAIARYLRLAASAGTGAGRYREARD